MGPTLGVEVRCWTWFPEVSPPVYPGGSTDPSLGAGSGLGRYRDNRRDPPRGSNTSVRTGPLTGPNGCPSVHRSWMWVASGESRRGESSEEPGRNLLSAEETLLHRVEPQPPLPEKLTTTRRW